MDSKYVRDEVETRVVIEGDEEVVGAVLYQGHEEMEMGI